MATRNTLSVAPTIETERLILRAHKRGDFETFARYLTEPDVIRYTTGDPVSEEEAWAKFLRGPGMWALIGYGFWAVEEKETGQFLGEVGFGDFKRNMAPEVGHFPEAGWVLGSQAQGKGYGSEAVGAFLAWGDENFVAHKTRCVILPKNKRSIRLAQNFGYREIGRANYYKKEVILFERPRFGRD